MSPYSGDEMRSLSDTVDDYHDTVVAMHLRKLNNEVDTDDVPLIFWSFCKLYGQCCSTVLQLGVIAKVTGFDIESNVPGHLWPPVFASDEFKCLKAACMYSDAYIMMLCYNTMPKLSVFGDIDPTSEHE
jgi:hypothetical protein